MESETRLADPKYAVYPVDLTPFPELYRTENIRLQKVFESKGHEFRIAGTAVCEILSGVTLNSVEYVTTATRAEMEELFKGWNIRILNRDEEASATVKACFLGVNRIFEITSLQKIVTPEEGYPRLINTGDWALDAAHHDLTVNSMYIWMDVETIPRVLTESRDDCLIRTNETFYIQGRVCDYHGGFQDFRSRKVKFIGDPIARIQENSISILRYFSFHGMIAEPAESDVHDPWILKVIKENNAGLECVSGEKCWAELKRIVRSEYAPQLLRRMHEVGLFPLLGLPEVPNFPEMDSVWEQGILNHNPYPITCLATLLTSFDQAKQLHKRLNFSVLERKILAYIIRNRGRCAAFTRDNAMEQFIREFALTQEDTGIVLQVLREMMRYLVYDAELLAEWDSWIPPLFLVTEYDLRTKWAVRPEDARLYLAILRQQWYDTNFTISPDDLLSDVNRNAANEILIYSGPDPIIWETWNNPL